MIRVAVTGLTVVLLAVGTAAQSYAQASDWASFGVTFGLFSPMTTFEHDMSGGEIAEASFASASAIGASATGYFALDRRLGVRAQIVRSETDGESSMSEFAPIAANDPTQWMYSAELIGRMPMTGGGLAWFPYASLGAGMKQYNWKRSIHDEDRAFMFTGAVGAEVRPATIGPFGITAELRAYQSKFKSFGINDGSWEPGTRARAGTNIGFYGGVTEGVNNLDLLFTTGLSFYF